MWLTDFVMKLDEASFEALAIAVDKRRAATIKDPKTGGLEFKAHELEFLRKGQLIFAVKSVRERTGLGLREAKEACEARDEFVKNPSPF